MANWSDGKIEVTLTKEFKKNVLENDKKKEALFWSFLYEYIFNKIAHYMNSLEEERFRFKELNDKMIHGFENKDKDSSFLFYGEGKWSLSSSLDYIFNEFFRKEFFNIEDIVIDKDVYTLSQMLQKWEEIEEPIKFKIVDLEEGNEVFYEEEIELYADNFKIIYSNNIPYTKDNLVDYGYYDDSELIEESDVQKLDFNEEVQYYKEKCNETISEEEIKECLLQAIKSRGNRFIRSDDVYFYIDEWF